MAPNRNSSLHLESPVMEALQFARQRYSAKKYDSSKSIPQEKIDALKEILRLTPSSINIQPWKFTFVQDDSVKRKLAAVSQHNEDKVNQAGLLIVFSVAEDLDAFQKVVDQNLEDRLRSWYNSLREKMPDSEVKNWMGRQVYIALGVGLSAAAAMGLDSTPMEGIEPDKYMSILNMTEYRPLFALSVGYGADDDHNRLEVTPKSRRPIDDVVECI